MYGIGGMVSPKGLFIMTVSETNNGKEVKRCPCGNRLDTSVNFTIDGNNVCFECYRKDDQNKESMSMVKTVSLLPKAYLPVVGKTNRDPIMCGNAFERLKELPDESVQLCITCPDPALSIRETMGDHTLFRNQVGAEPTIAEYVNNLMRLFGEVERVLKDNGSLYVMMGDYHYNGNLIGIPERFMIRMIDSGWYLKSKLIWHRTEPMRQEDTKRFKRDHEFIYFFTKQNDGYYFNDRKHKHYKNSVLSYPYGEPQPGKFESGLPTGIIMKLIESSSKEKDMVLDPLAGTGTVGYVAKHLKRNFTMIELDPIQCDRMRERLL